MTVVAVFADPPWEGVALSGLAGRTPLSPAEAARLYEASLKDVVTAVAASGGELLVNYRPAELVAAGPIPDDSNGRDSGEDGPAAAAVRRVVADALEDAGDVRFEVQVGSTRAARIGNTVTHLLDHEDATSAAFVPGCAALLSRTIVDGAAMKLRSAPVVLGPAVDGGVYYAGFTEPVDFEDADAPPAVETLTGRALAADLETDYLEVTPTLSTPAGLRTAVSLVRSRVRAGRIVPEHTAIAVDELGLAVAADASADGTVAVERE